MKKFFAVIILSSFATVAYAQHRHHNHYYHYHHQHRHNHNMAILGAAVLGAGITYMATRPQSVIVQEPVYVEQRPIYIERQDLQNCTGWREIQTSNGQIYRERYCR